MSKRKKAATKAATTKKPSAESGSTTPPPSEVPAGKESGKSKGPKATAAPQGPAKAVRSHVSSAIAKLRKENPRLYWYGGMKIVRDAIEELNKPGQEEVYRTANRMAPELWHDVKMKRQKNQKKMRSELGQ